MNGVIDIDGELRLAISIDEMHGTADEWIEAVERRQDFQAP